MHAKIHAPDNTLKSDISTPRAADPRRPVIWHTIAPVVAAVAQRLDRMFHWDRLPRPLGILALLGLRHGLREHNLYDPLPGRPAGGEQADQGAAPTGPPPSTRRIDGRDTHPSRSAMGAIGTSFGRNLPVAPTRGGPAPALVSEALLKRRQFVPATSLNMLAAAWLQFEVHDWFAHQVQADAEPLPIGLQPLKPDGASTPNLPVFLSDQSHWWDASQLYGADPCFANAVRSADSHETGKVCIDEQLLQVIETFQAGGEDAICRDHQHPPNPVPNLWLGLALYHVVFAREHNALCDRLHKANAEWSGQRLYDQARMINAAVMAKIHTVEWTPALLAHPTVIHSIKSTWWGLLGEPFRRRFGRIGSGDLLSGIPGSWLDDDVSYALTEEFAAVYRMHPLLPTQLNFHRVADDAPIALDGREAVPFEELVATRQHPARAREQLHAIEVENAWYSLAVACPGALTLHNHPSFAAPLAAGGTVDLGAADILRTRECGVPRYNEFRRALRMPEAKSFLELADGNRQFAAEINEAYDGEIEDVDLIVGIMADRKPKGFAISDTAFRIFLLMASRRLRSDRFFTTDYTPARYTQLGFDWIDDASMAGILRRHYPALTAALDGVPNVFAPWPRMPAAS